MKMIFIFIDGFGLGERDKYKNPVFAANTPYMDYILKNSRLIPTDPTLGVPGLPQSATGQTAIFTGINASKVLGRHLNGQPTITLKNIINENNLFRELMSRNLRVTNANVYRDEYLSKMMNETDRKHRPSVTSVMTMSVGLQFGRIADYAEGKGVYHDITGTILKESGYDVELITPEQAAERLYQKSRDYDFTLYEHFMTDIIGHKTDMELAVKEIELLDAFLGEITRLVDFNEYILFITSDHGNIEDVSVKTHTMNKVPTIVMGNVPKGAFPHIQSLTDIMPAVLELFDADRK